MKKAISLYVAVMCGIVVFAQDTTAGKNNFPPNNNRDTVPGNSAWNKKDTSFSSKGQWPKDSVNKKTWPNTDSTLQHSGNMKTDSTNTTYQSGSQTGSTQDTSTSTSSQKSTTTAADNKATDTVTLTDRIMMKDDQMFMVKNNESSLLDKNYKLESGAVITTDGMVKYPGGKSVKLKNGQFIELAPAAESSDAKKSTHKKTSSKGATTAKKKKTPNA